LNAKFKNLYIVQHRIMLVFSKLGTDLWQGNWG
jgi:hypothetical protein